MKPITATEARYIKLGSTGRWERNALEEGIMPISYREIPHEIANEKDFRKIRDYYAELGHAPNACSDKARQLAEFYILGRDTLWVTFHGGLVWWCFAEPEVIPTTPEQVATKGTRYRCVIGQWYSTDIHGKPLYVDAMSGSFTKTAAYQQVICAIKPEQLEYLVRKINGELLPVLVKAESAKTAMLESLQELIKMLREKDFELFVDLLFSQSGWRRLSVVGGTQKTIDLQLEMPVTRERAFVQVKSQTRQREFEDYLQRLREHSDTRMFFAYHTASKPIQNSSQEVTILDAPRLAEMALDAGLSEWLMQKVG